MTRIIAGAAGGRRLETPKGDRTRPTSDRVREAVFSTIESWCGSLDGLRFLDLYAGSGAIGLEAWSRGAAHVTLVESDRRTADLIGRNLRAVGAARTPPAVAVAARPVGAVLAERPAAPYDLVFSDPPYPLTEPDLADDLALLLTHGWLSDDALVLVERSVRSPEPAWPPGLEPLAGKRGRKKYGETAIWLAARATPDDREPDH